MHTVVKITTGFHGSQEKQEDRILKESFNSSYNDTSSASSDRTLTGSTSFYGPANHSAVDSLQSAGSKAKRRDDEVITVVGYRTPEEAHAAGEARRKLLKGADTGYSGNTISISTNGLPSRVTEKTNKVVIGYKLPRPQVKSGY